MIDVLSLSDGMHLIPTETGPQIVSVNSFPDRKEISIHHEPTIHGENSKHVTTMAKAGVSANGADDSTGQSNGTFVDPPEVAEVSAPAPVLAKSGEMAEESITQPAPDLEPSNPEVDDLFAEAPEITLPSTDDLFADEPAPVPTPQHLPEPPSEVPVAAAEIDNGDLFGTEEFFEPEPIAEPEPSTQATSVGDDIDDLFPDEGEDVFTTTEADLDEGAMLDPAALALAKRANEESAQSAPVEVDPVVEEPVENIFEEPAPAAAFSDQDEDVFEDSDPVETQADEDEDDLWT